jgi:hypothetical protein
VRLGPVRTSGLVMVKRWPRRDPAAALGFTSAWVATGVCNGVLSPAWLRGYLHADRPVRPGPPLVMGVPEVTVLRVAAQSRGDRQRLPPHLRISGQLVPFAPDLAQGG